MLLLMHLSRPLIIMLLLVTMCSAAVLQLIPDAFHAAFGSYSLVLIAGGGHFAGGRSTGRLFII